MATKTIVYARVSTDKQADAGVSLEAQQAKAAAYASLYDLTIIDTVTDSGVSAKTLSRPKLQRALAKLHTGEADALLVTKLDRLTRSVSDLGQLIKDHFSANGGELMSVSEQIDTRSANGRLTLNVLMSVSQWEREVIGERTSEAMQHMRTNGEYTGGRAPYGFQRINDRLVADEVEQLIIEQARALRSSGLSLAKVAFALDTRGFRARNGQLFVAQQIKRMVV